jgi:hypothetical protein
MVPAEVVMLASAWLRRTFGAPRAILGGRGVRFSGGTAYHLRAERPPGDPALRVEVVVFDDGTIQGPRRLGSHERRRVALAVRRVEGRRGVSR